MEARVLSSIDAVDADAWDALTGASDPFVEHAFLRGLERSGSVGQEAGWEPRHLTLWEGERLCAAMPLYLKTHSYGEFIFDWAWADAAMRAGIAYYPKLVSMVPVTPVTGRRFLFAEGMEPKRMVTALLEAAVEVAEVEGASSVHVLFLRDEEIDAFDPSTPYLRRLTHQFHWENQAYATFDDYVQTFRSSMRKQVRRERKRAAAHGLELRVVTGTELKPSEWEALYPLYRRGCARYGSPDYLTAEFFTYMQEHLAHRVVVAMAQLEGEIRAASLGFEKGDCLYGRYWGALEEYDCMHFELCYYQLLERAIEGGKRRFEAGAQGTHKLRRGLLPREIHSLHWIRDERLREAVADFLPREAFIEGRRIEALSHHGPFRREG